MPEPLPIEGRSQRVKCGRNTSDLYMLQADVHEGLNVITDIEVEFLAKKLTVKPDDFLSDVFTIEMDIKDNPPRKWLATCVEATFLGISEGMGYGEYPHFRVRLRGWPWLLTRIADCRIFQEKHADDIVKEIFSDNGFSDVEWKVGAAPPVREYCVQYRESSWDFVCRLLAEEGRFWFFDYSGGKDKLVICDDSAKLTAIPGNATIELIDKEAGAREEIDYVDNWHALHRVETDKITLRDYDFKKSTVKLEGTRQGTTQKYEEYDYPGLFLENADGTKMARRRLEAITAATKRVSGQGIVKQLHAGGKMTLAKHPDTSQNKEHVILEAHHKLRLEPMDEDKGGMNPKSIYKKVEKAVIGGKLGRGVRDLATSDFGQRARQVAKKALGSVNSEELKEMQSVEFEAQLASVPYVAPPLPVPLPIIHGIQTAEVVGPSGEEIYTDEHGRVKVQFHWDRKGQKDENTTCFIRVATPIAGKGWGMIHIPRIGQEVVVQFLEGCPDRPLIVGSVYNDQQTPMFSLPDNKTRIGLVSDTHKNEDANAKHELWFEELKDSELLRIQSEKNYEMNIKNSAEVNIGTEDKPEGDYDFKVWRHTTRSYGEGSGEGNVTETIQNNFEKTILDGDYTLGIDTGSRITTIQTDDTLTVTGDSSETVTGKKDVTVTGAIKVVSQQKITLECGGSTIEMTPAKITISSPQISLQADGKVEASAPMVDINGSGMVKVQGGLVKIN